MPKQRCQLTLGVPMRLSGGQRDDGAQVTKHRREQRQTQRAGARKGALMLCQELPSFLGLSAVKKDQRARFNPQHVLRVDALALNALLRRLYVLLGLIRLVIAQREPVARSQPQEHLLRAPPSLDGVLEEGRELQAEPPKVSHPAQ